MLYEVPANLLYDEFQKDFNGAEAFWVVKNGLKMTGMPAFGSQFEDGELWGAVAFVRPLPKISPVEYRTIIRKIDKPGA